MQFDSLIYFYFLLLVVPTTYFLRSKSSNAHNWLLFASFFFYGYWSPFYLILILYTAWSVFLISSQIHQAEDKKTKYRWVILSIINCLLVLFIFKYLSFCLENVNHILSYFGVSAYTLPVPTILLPVGISFYTFQAMSYSLDIYRGFLKPCIKFRDFLLYVSFFPQLVAGPIVRAKDFLPQLKEIPVVSKGMFNAGVFFILMGLIKKVFIADLLGFYFINSSFERPDLASVSELWLAFYGFPFQLYNDFSGYSDVAIGSALLLGYKITDNFDSPFLTKNPAEFWNRWHISLSVWIRDYIFYPLLLSKKFLQKQKTCMMITMIIMGVWHGATFGFLLLGLYHGILMSVHNFLYANNKKQVGKMYAFIQWVVFFHLICFGFFLFRVNEVSEIDDFILRMIRLDLLSFSMTNMHLELWLPAIGLHFIRAEKWHNLSQKFSEISIFLRLAFVILACVLFVHSFMIVRSHAAFIYFQF